MKDEKKIWEHHVDHNLFAISKLDITVSTYTSCCAIILLLFSSSQNDGQDEIITCSWNGATYILDHSRNVVRYKFEDNVCAFCAGKCHTSISCHFCCRFPLGLFGFTSEHNKPVLIYSTFFNKIYVYHNITLSSVPPSSLTLRVSKKVRELTITECHYM